MKNPEKIIIDYQRELFAALEEFFERATGQSPDEFATFETFPDVIRGRAEILARRGQDAYPWADIHIRDLQSIKGAQVFRAAKEIGGVKLVLGGSSRFHDTHFDAVKANLLYADTVLIPDPLLPWLETPREEERFRHILFLQAAFILLHLKPLIDGDFPFPPIVIFPSWEKLLEEHDPQTQKSILQLVTDIIAHHIDIGLQSFEDVLEFINRYPDQFLKGIEDHNLFLPPEGIIGEPLTMALRRYQQNASTWRSEDWVEHLPPAKIVLKGIMERISPQYHLLENAEELNSHPLLCIEQQAYYYRIIADNCAERLSRLTLLDKSTHTIVNSLGSKRLRWLSNIPIATLVDLRKNNENTRFRERLLRILDRLHESSIDETDRVVAEVCHGISALMGDHERDLREVESKYSRIHGQTAVTCGAAIIAMLVPSLAPFLGTIAPFALASKYAWDKIAEMDEKKKLSKSLMGVLSLAKNQSE